VKSDPPAEPEPRIEGHESERPIERLVPELIKRIIEAGVERLSEGPENVRRVVSDLRLPREALAAILAQLDETKGGVYRVVAKEVRERLAEMNFGEELAKALTSLTFEVRTTVRFVPSEGRARPSPEVRSSVAVQRGEEREEPTIPPPATPRASKPDGSRT
jgi:hypothetical protein